MIAFGRICTPHVLMLIVVVLQLVYRQRSERCWIWSTAIPQQQGFHSSLEDVDDDDHDDDAL